MTVPCMKLGNWLNTQYTHRFLSPTPFLCPQTIPLSIRPFHSQFPVPKLKFTSTCPTTGCLATLFGLKGVPVSLHPLTSAVSDPSNLHGSHIHATSVKSWPGLYACSCIQKRSIWNSTDLLQCSKIIPQRSIAPGSMLLRQPLQYLQEPGAPLSAVGSEPEGMDGTAMLRGLIEELSVLKWVSTSAPLSIVLNSCNALHSCILILT